MVTSTTSQYAARSNNFSACRLAFRMAQRAITDFALYKVFIAISHKRNAIKAILH